MTTTTLPDRLRALADLIETHNLPDLPTSLSSPEKYVSIHAQNVEQVEVWAAALGVEVASVRYESPDGPWTAHSASMDYLTDGPIHVHVQFSETHAQAVA